MPAAASTLAAVTPARVVILGDQIALAEALAVRLRAADAADVVITGAGAADSEITTTLTTGDWNAVVIVSHEDALALRLTLLAAQVRPDLPLWATMFDRTLVHRLHEIVPEVNIVAASEIAATELADLCTELCRRQHRPRWSGIRLVDDALRLMVLAGIGLALTLTTQVVVTLTTLHNNLINAVYFSTRSLATVADVPGSSGAPDWYKLLSSFTTIASVGLVAVFTAALVKRLGRRRLTTVLGKRRAVARGHVIIVGFGQIGFRLAQLLRERGIHVTAIERDQLAPCVRLASRAQIPVSIGHGDDRSMLKRAGVRTCAAVAAVTSDDLANVATGLAATDLREDVPLVLRLGDGDVASETESLLHLGRVCDTHQLLAGRITVMVMAGHAGRERQLPAAGLSG